MDKETPESDKLKLEFIASALKDLREKRAIQPARPVVKLKDGFAELEPQEPLENITLFREGLDLNVMREEAHQRREKKTQELLKRWKLDEQDMDLQKSISEQAQENRSKKKLEKFSEMLMQENIAEFFVGYNKQGLEECQEQLEKELNSDTPNVTLIKKLKSEINRYQSAIPSSERSLDWQREENAFFLKHGIDLYAIANKNHKPFDPEEAAREWDEAHPEDA